MTGQLELLDKEPRPLTPRQQAVLDKLRSLQGDGLTAEDAGAYVHWSQGRHAYDTPCRWCAHAGTEILKALRARGLARQSRKLGGWVADGAATPDPPGMTTEIPY